MFIVGVMLDELLGRAALRDEISEREEAIERLEAQLAAEEDRRKEAVRDRQAADERSNRLEDRIADLEGQVDNLQSGEWSPRFRGRMEVSVNRMSTVLDWVQSFEYGEEEAYTAMVTETMPETIRDVFGDHAVLVDRAKPCLVLTDSLGVLSVALSPPVAPSPFESWDDSFTLDESWFLPRGEFAFALVRSDVFAYAEYDDHTPGYRTSFESDIRQNHSKGGFSQGRFERRRDEQIDAHLGEAAAVIADRDPDDLIVVGERTVIDAFEDEAMVLEAVDATGSPDDALATAFDSFWSTTLYQI